MNTVQANGKTFAYERCGNGIPLLLIHGFPLDHAIWSPLDAQLSAHFDVIMPDLPGFGHSERLDGSPNLDDMAAALAGFLDALSIGAVFIAGHSMGGYISLAFAHNFAQKTLGLGLLGSQVLSDSQERQTERYATAELVTKEGVDVLTGMAEKLTANPAFIPQLRQIILRQPPKGIAAALGAMARRTDASQFIQTFSFPVVLVHGLADSLIPVERAREIKELLPKAQLVELPHVGHSPMLEAPAETAQALLRLLD